MSHDQSLHFLSARKGSRGFRKRMLYKETSAFPCHALLQTDTDTPARKLLSVENNVQGKKKMGCE